MTNTSFVPLSLADALTSSSSTSRTYTSSQAASHGALQGRRTSTTTTTGAGQSPSASNIGGPMSARAKARTMLKALGIQEDDDETREDDEGQVDSTLAATKKTSVNDKAPLPDTTRPQSADERDALTTDAHGLDSPVVERNLAKPRPSSMVMTGTPVHSTSSTDLVLRLRKQIEALQSDKKLLKQKIETLEKDKRQWQTNEQGLHAQLKQKLGSDVKLEELVKSFERLRRLTDFLSDHFGQQWERDLNLSLDLTKPAATRQTFASPISDRRFGTAQSDQSFVQQMGVEARDEPEAPPSQSLPPPPAIAESNDKDETLPTSDNRIPQGSLTQQPTSSLHETVSSKTATLLVAHIERTEALLDAMTIKLGERDERLKQTEFNANKEAERAWAEVNALRKKLAALEKKDPAGVPSV
ncbi:hypothetical protein OIV83_002643 [Microbotryomycetes sp. JL201]|nr:hypothetical protein OIV83_002643 [Microbotryomycetes sp. JL201]